MLIIKLTPESNGAYANQRSANFNTIPEGWAAVPEELEQIANDALPWIELAIDGNVIVGITPATAPEKPPPDDGTQFGLFASMADIVQIRVEIDALTTAANALLNGGQA